LEEKQGKRTKIRRKRKERVSLGRMKIMIVLSLQQAASGKEHSKLRQYMWIQEATMVQMDTKGYDGNNGYASYNST